MRGVYAAALHFGPAFKTDRPKTHVFAHHSGITPRLFEPPFDVLPHSGFTLWADREKMPLWFYEDFKKV